MADAPPELDMENFENALAEVDVEFFDVIDEVGEDDSADEANKRKKKDERSRTRSIGNRSDRSHSSRHRSRSPRRYNRSRSRDRVRHRSPPRRRSPKGGAADFLKDIQKQFGEFEGLKEVEKKVKSHSIMEDRPDKDRPDNRFRRNNRYNQHPKQQQQQYQNMNNGMPMQNQMNPMMMNLMYNPQMMGPTMPQMPYPSGSGFNDGLCPPGVDAPMNMQQPSFVPQQPMVVIPQQQAMNPMISMPQQQQQPPIVSPIMTSNSGTQSVSEKSPFRNASPPADIDFGNVKASLLSQNKINLSEFLETQASRGAAKTIEARPLKDRVIAKCKAAVFRLEQAANGNQFERQFLHVPPTIPSDTTDAIGASPVVPSKHNPVFRFSTKNIDAIQKSRPYPTVSRNIQPLIAQLGLDESVIARRHETSSRESEENSSQTRAYSNNFASRPPLTPGILQSRNEMRDVGSQTPTLSCAKCEKRRSNLMNTQTQTKVIEKYSFSTQTLESDFQLAKLRLKHWEKKQQMNLNSFKREYAEAFADDDERRDSPPKAKPRVPIAPPGFREKPDTTKASKSNQNSSYDNAIRTYYDKFRSGF